MTDDQIPPASELPNVVGLTGTEAVFRILAYTREPMKMEGIHRWLEDNKQPSLTAGQIAGAFRRLTLAYEKVVERTAKGIYRIHSEWNGDPLDRQSRMPIEDDAEHDTAATTKADKGETGILIPCYGLHWHRDQVEWDTETQLLGFLPDDGDSVNFACQWGVYILYNWPNITYVGRTAGRLYLRLKEHTKKSLPSGEWDRFSWFGLCPVDGDGTGPPQSLDNSNVVAAFETLLIITLSPPANRIQGAGLGKRYSQVPDPIVEEREREALGEQMKKLWASARFGKS